MRQVLKLVNQLLFRTSFVVFLFFFEARVYLKLVALEEGVKTLTVETVEEYEQKE
jgi:hypothetical protein